MGGRRQQICARALASRGLLGAELDLVEQRLHSERLSVTSLASLAWACVAWWQSRSPACFWVRQRLQHPDIPTEVEGP